jgi:hypothetical protein
MEKSAEILYTQKLLFITEHSGIHDRKKLQWQLEKRNLLMKNVHNSFNELLDYYYYY